MSKAHTDALDAARRLGDGKPTAIAREWDRGIVAAELRNAMQPLLLCAEASGDADALECVLRVLNIASALEGRK